MKVDLTQIKPYGDTLDDGLVQHSFTLPVALSGASKEAARQLVAAWGFEEPAIAHAEAIGDNFSFYIAYAKCKKSVDMTRIVVSDLVADILSKEEIDQSIAQQLGRKMVVIGACIESDAHTVGIDAIMNMKGFNGHKGLESYHQIQAVNLGAQVSCEELIRKIYETSADAVLISQVVTQKNIHVTNLNKLTDMLEAEGIRDRIILAVGGPRITQELAKELGYDGGFGPNTYAEHVATFLVRQVAQKLAK